jgi:hypothetical protein
VSIEHSYLLQVQSELISGLALILEGVAETTTDSATRHTALTALDSILLCFEQLGAMYDAVGQTKH